MRLFVAVSVGEEVRAAAARAHAVIEGALQQLRGPVPRLVWVLPPSLHLTLKFLGEQPDARVPGFLEAIQDPYPVAPFTVTWRGLGAFPSRRRPRVLWLGVTDGAGELGQLEVEVARRCGTLMPGEATEDAKPFHPHLTLARLKVEGAAVDWPRLLEAGDVGGVTSVVEHVSLFRSRGLPGGAGYEEIGRGRLDG